MVVLHTWSKVHLAPRNLSHFVWAFLKYSSHNDNAKHDVNWSDKQKWKCGEMKPRNNCDNGNESTCICLERITTNTFINLRKQSPRLQTKNKTWSYIFLYTHPRGFSNKIVKIIAILIKITQKLVIFLYKYTIMHVKNITGLKCHY